MLPERHRVKRPDTNVPTEHKLDHYGRRHTPGYELPSHNLADDRNAASAWLCPCSAGSAGSSAKKGVHRLRYDRHTCRAAADTDVYGCKQ